jgi:hypothetical protein
MAIITLRKVKGSKLNSTEGDANFNNLNVEVMAATANVLKVNANLSSFGVLDTTGKLVRKSFTPKDLTKSYGTLITAWAGATYANGGLQVDSDACPDSAAYSYVLAKLPGKDTDPVATVTVTGLSIVCNTVNDLVIWAKATARAGDVITTAMPLQVYLGVGGFTKNANITALAPADGLWHPLLLNKFNFTQAGGFLFTSSDVITQIRIKPIDVAQDAAYGYDTPKATGNESITLGPVRYNPTSRAKFMIRFDDSIGDLAQPVVTNTFSLPDGTVAPAAGWSALTLLNHYGFRASCFHLPRRIGTSNSIVTHATWDDLKILANAGWDNCFQSYFDPANSSFNDGIRLLGPDGYAARTVASVNTTSNTITASAVHGIFTLGGYAGYPIVFSGTSLPAPLVTGKVYWAVATTTTAFALYPTEVDAINNTNVIDITTTGTAANFTFRYGFARNDYTRYAEDIELGRRLLIDNGYEEESKYWAVNQGASDGEVMKAAVAAGIKAVFGIYKGATPSFFFGQYPHTENNGTNPALDWKAIMKIVGGIQTDAGSGVVTATDARNYVDSVVAAGGWGQNYHHRITNLNGPVLAALLDQLKIKSDAGLIDVVTATELPL